VTELAADRAGWGKTLAKGEGMGIAAHRSFLSYTASVVHVAVDNQGKLVIRQVDTAVDCGFHVNPERIRSQIEGAAVMGLELAKHGQITFKNGRPEQDNFRWVRISADRRGTPERANPYCSGRLACTGEWHR
jgi:isoquinoline 1-oxidoreductase subunit beta